MAKVMLVEDDNNLREIYEARLQAEGYTIVSAKDGEEALVVAKAEKPDLIISDVMMPKISGFEMLDILRNTEGLKDVKVIMLTALGQSDDQQRAEKLGADRYLVKSQVTLEDIVDVAKQLMSGETAASTTESKPAVDQPKTETPTPEPAAPASESAASGDEIENFVAGATSDASAPNETSAEPAAPATTTIPVTSDDSADEPTAAAEDDKLMADAVDTLVNDTSGKTDAAAEPAQAEPTVVAPTETKPEADAKPETNQSSEKPAGSKKVIKPLDAPPKTDINELLAAEEAKNKVEPEAKPIVGDVSKNKASESDPNSIAL